MSVYLDYNAARPVLPEAVEAVLEVMRGTPGNPSSRHVFGQAAAERLDRARRVLADFAGAAPDEILLTGSGTESVQSAVCGMARATERGRHLITSAIEHAAGRDAARRLAAEGWRITEVAPGPGGVVCVDAVAAALRDDTALVSLIHAESETGAIQPVEEMAALCRGRGVPFHVDAVQSAGKIPLPAYDGVTALSVGSAKLGGPRGTAFVRLRRGCAFQSLLAGTQERGRRGGTVDVAAAAGFAAAAKIADTERETAAVHCRALRDRLEGLVIQDVPSARVTAGEAERLPNTAHFTFDPRVGEDLVPALDLAGFAISAGSACMSGSDAPSPVLLAMGVSAERARTGVRVSLGPDTTVAEVGGFVEALARIVRARLATGAPAR